jgi:ribose transport system substrate-binding protein
VSEMEQGRLGHRVPGRARWGATILTAAFVFGACSGGATTAPASAAPSTAPASAAASTAPATQCAAADIRLVGQVRNVSNPYEASWLAGGEFFAGSVGLVQQKLTYDGDSQKQISQIRTLLATGTGQCTIMNVLPNGNADTLALVKAAKDAGAYIVTQWNKPDDLNPWAGYDTWASHITYDGKVGGYLIAKALFDAMGGKGNVVALQGILDTGAAKDRFIGLQKALSENPNIKLLDQQTANFDRTQALGITKTWLTKYGDQINGVWTANDDMGLGALEALKSAKLAGKVPVVGMDAVPEALKDVQDGTFAATVTSDGYWQGGIGLAMGYCALTGKLDIPSLSHDKRAFFAKQTLVNKDNVAKFISTPSADSYAPEWKCDNLFNRFDAPIVAGQ